MIRRHGSGTAWEASAAYARVVEAGDWVMVSGTTGYNHTTGVIPEAVEKQCALALRHIAGALEGVGLGLSDVVRVTYILPERDDFPACWPALRAAFGEAPPAATMIQAGLIDPRLKIEIEVTAWRGGADA